MSELEFKEFICKKCGICCKNEYILPEITKEEWLPIIEFLKKKYEGKLKIKDMDTPSEYEIYDLNKITDFLVEINNIDSDIFWVLDNGKCPFLKKKKKGTYYCEIHEIKPQVCKKYRCDLNSNDFMIYLEQLEVLKLKGSE